MHLLFRQNTESSHGHYWRCPRNVSRDWKREEQKSEKETQSLLTLTKRPPLSKVTCVGKRPRHARGQETTEELLLASTLPLSSWDWHFHVGLTKVQMVELAKVAVKKCSEDPWQEGGECSAIKVCLSAKLLSVWHPFFLKCCFLFFFFLNRSVRKTLFKKLSGSR